MTQPAPPSSRFRRIGELFHAVVEVPPQERAAFLDTACGGDASLRAEVEALLRADESAPTLAAALVVDARQLAGDFRDEAAAGVELAPGARLGRYEIVAPLGAGGMGEVWRARDTRLGREVAIKVLPRHLTADRDALSRFEREARAVAALSHPNILAIHDFDREGEVFFAVTELLEGQTLREVLRTGAVSRRRAREWGAQIARALAAAHDRGIVHRDVKPENLVLTRDDVVKLLDFGVARQRGPLGSPDGSGASAPTGTGIVLGTAGYMAPEQVRGEAVDSRADLFALGCVLYELLLGERAFAKGSIVETLAAIVNQEPPRLETLAESTSPELARIVRRCLEKRPDHRFQSAHDLAFALEGSAGTGPTSTSMTDAREVTLADSRSRSRRRLWAAVGVGAVLASLLAATLVGRRLAVPAAPAALHATLNLTPAGEVLDYTSLALAPDGKTVAFVATDQGEQRLWVRSLVADERRMLAGTEDATYPFWSPDSSHVGFFAQGKLKRVPAAGGPVLTVATAEDGRGGTWNAAGEIVFAPKPRHGLQRVPAGGGTPETVTQLAAPTSSHRFPRFLPDGKHLLFAVAVDPAGRNGLYHLDLGSGESRRVLPDTGDGHFAQGRLLFYRDGSLVAQPFDPVRGELSGAAVAVAAGVYNWPLRNQLCAAVGERLLAYFPSAGRESVLTWFDAAGRETAKVGEPGPWSGVELSLDGTQAAVFREGTRGTELWLVDVVEGTFRRRASDIPNEIGVAWSPSGDELLVARETAPGQFQLVVLSARDGSERILDRSLVYLQPGGWTADGATVLYVRGGDLWTVAADGKSPGTALAVTPWGENNPRLSPDGRWLVFISNEGGRYEYYVAPFPALTARTPVFLTGAPWSVDWSEDGRALDYLDVGAQAIRRVAVGERNGQLRFGAPAHAFEHLDMQNVVGADYEPRGRRLLAAVMVRKTLPPVQLVVDWPSLLQQPSP